MSSGRNATRRWAFGRFLGAAEALGFENPRRIAGAVTSAMARTVPSAFMAQLAEIDLLEDVVQQVILAMVEHVRANGTHDDIALMRAVQRAAYAALTQSGWRRLSRQRDRSMRWLEKEIPAGDGEVTYEIMARAIANGRAPSFRAMVQRFYGLPPTDDRDLRPWEHGEPQTLSEVTHENENCASR